jgi:membrane peptidoglycan carboxypeptidase
MSGTAKLLNFTAIPIAAKTGTVAWDKGNKDVWLASYNPDDVVVCWEGFDKTDDAHHLSTSVSGGTYPAQVCKEVYSWLYSKTTAPTFQVPDSVTLVALDGVALQNTHQILLASEYTPEDQKLYEYFPKTQAPTQVSSYWQTPQTPTGFSVTLSDRGYPAISFTILQDFVRYDVYRTDQYGNSTNVKQIQGAVNSTASFEDYFVQPGVYSYYVSPVNPQQNVTGSSTSALQITVGANAQTTAPASSSPSFPYNVLPFLSPSPTPAATPQPGIVG